MSRNLYKVTRTVMGKPDKSFTFYLFETEDEAQAFIEKQDQDAKTEYSISPLFTD